MLDPNEGSRKNMGEPKLENLEMGRDVIESLMLALNINSTQLAGLLGVSVRTFTNWNKTLVASGRGKFLRLTILRSIVDEAIGSGLESQQVLNFLNHPIPEDEENRALLYYIWEGREHKLISLIARRLLRETVAGAAMGQASKAENLSTKETFREHFGPINDETLREASSSNPSLVCQLMDEGMLSTPALAAAAEALGYTLNPELIDRLINLLKHQNAYVREGAVAALGSFLYHGIEEEKIRGALKYSETSKAVKESIQEALELGE